MQVVQPVPAELHTQLGRPLKPENDGSLARRTTTYGTRQGADLHMLHRTPRSHHLHFNRLIHVELHEGSLAARVHVDLHAEHLQFLPPAAAFQPPDVDLVCLVARHHLV